jgi:hypothetical protein
MSTEALTNLFSLIHAHGKRTTILVDQRSAKSMALAILDHYPKPTRWYFNSKDSKGNGDFTVSERLGEFVAYPKHSYVMDSGVDGYSENPSLLTVIASQRVVSYTTNCDFATGYKLQHPFVFFFVTENFSPLTVPTIHALDDFVIKVNQGVVEMLKDRTGQAPARFVIPFREWPKAVAKTEDLNTILEMLYDAKYKKKPYDVVDLLKRYNKLTGKKTPAFM